MSAINFVVRDGAGIVSRGSVAGEGVASSLSVGSATDVSLNLSAGQVISYIRQGQSLQITLIDGRTILIEGFFAADGMTENQLFLSSDGFLSEVKLTQGAGADYYANYVEIGSGAGKYAADEDLYFMRGADVMLAEGYPPADDEVGMLGAALGGIAPLFGWGGAAAVAAVGAATLLPDGDGGDSGPAVPAVIITSGTVDSDDRVVNAEDHADGVEIGGTGTVGATVDVSIDGHTETTVVNPVGTWGVTFDPADIATGDYTTPIKVTITNEDGSSTVTDSLIVDTIIDVDMQTPGGSDGVINATEHSEGVTLSGTVTGGDSVVVTIDGVEYAATVAGSGWTLDLASGALPGGEYNTMVIATATDAAGNTSTLSESVSVDTVAGDLALSTQPIEIDDVVNLVKHSDGVIIKGTATPGLTVTVGLGNASLSVVSANDGTWSVTFPEHMIPDGTYESAITASITDAAGNYKEVSDTVQIDTEVVPFNFSADPVAEDGVISKAEVADGVTLSGDVEAHPSVTVQFRGQSVMVKAADDGHWSADFTGAGIVDGEYNATIKATATDPAGNVSVITETVQIDTIVNRLTADGPVEGDDIVNRAEAADGITLGGTVEIGSKVIVTFEGLNRAATVDGAGNWSVSYDASEIPAGQYEANVTIAATDAYGNTDSITDLFDVNTVTPSAPGVESVTISSTGVEYVGIESTGNDMSVNEITSRGGNNLLADQDDGIALAWGETLFNFKPALPDGSHLVINQTDAAGNANATYIVLEEKGTDIVDTIGLGNFDVGAIDLSFAKDSELTLDLETLIGLSDIDNNLVIHGGDDDFVALNGATKTAATTQIDSQTYDIYTMGDDAQIFIDDDINVTI